MRVAILLLVAAGGGVVSASVAAEVRLVDFADDGAVFSGDGGMKLVRVGSPVPGTEATLLQVGNDRIALEFPASASRPGAIQRLARGQVVTPLTPEQLTSPQQSPPQIDVRMIPAPPGTKVPPGINARAESQR